jgi:hypothetical protein
MGSFLDTLLLGIKKVFRNGNPMPTRQIINFIGFTNVLDNPALGTTDVYGSSTGSSTSGIILIENNGVAEPQRPTLNLVSGFTITDNAGNNSTDVTAVPAPPLLVSSGGSPITQRATLDLIGFSYADDAIGNRMRFTTQPILPAPGTTIIAAGTTIGPTDLFKLIQPSLTPYTITWGAIVPGVIYRMLTVPGSLGGFAANPCTVSRGANTFTIEDPQNRYASPANTKTLQVDGVCYEWMLESTNNVLRCMRQV